MIHKHGHIVVAQQAVEVQGKDCQNRGQDDGQLHTHEGVEGLCTHIPGCILQRIIQRKESSLGHTQGEGDLDDDVADEHDDGGAGQNLVEHPDARGVVGGDQTQSHQSGGQQPRDQQTVFQCAAQTVLALLQDAAGDQNDDCHKGSSNSGVGDTDHEGLVGGSLLEDGDVVLQSEAGQGQVLACDGGRVGEGEQDDQCHGDDIDEEQQVSVHMSQNVQDGVADLLLDDGGLDFRNGHIMAALLDLDHDGQQDDGGNAKEQCQQSCQRTGADVVGEGQDHGGDGLEVLTANQQRCGSSRQTGNKGQNGDSHQRRGQHRQHHLGQDAELGCSHVLCSLDGLEVHRTHGVAEEDHVVGGAGEGHNEQNCPVAFKPVNGEAGDDLGEQGGQDTGLAVDELVAGNQNNAAVDQGGHVAQTEDVGTLDVKILGDQHQTDADKANRKGQGGCKDQAVPQASHCLGRVDQLGEDLGGKVTVLVEHAHHGVEVGEYQKCENEPCEEHKNCNSPQLFRRK